MAQMNFDDKKSLGYLEGFSSVVLNTALFVLKFWAGTRIGSVAMKADAWHTLSDTLTSFVLIFGFWLSARPADEKHTFGHGRAEAVSSVIIGTLLAVVGANFLKESVVCLVNRRSVTFELFGIIVFLISAVTKESLAQFSFWAGRKTESKSLAADGWHHRSDAIASALIVLGALFEKYFWWMDGVLGIGVSILILYATFSILRDASSYLIGESPAGHLEKKIRGAIQSAHPALDSIHHIHVHNYGDHLEITAHIKLPPEMDVEEAHNIATKAEIVLKKYLKAEATIHIEPAPRKLVPKE
jgi:cation diffusion facilitator family transporter